MRMRRSFVATVVGGVGMTALLISASPGQIRDDDRGKKEASFFGVDWSKGDAPLA